MKLVIIILTLLMVITPNVVFASNGSTTNFSELIKQFFDKLFGHPPPATKPISNPTSNTIDNSCENDISGIVEEIVKSTKWGGLSPKDTQMLSTLQKNSHGDCKGIIISNNLVDKLVHEVYAKERGFPMVAKSCNDVMPMLKEIDRNAVPDRNGGYVYTQKQWDDSHELVFEGAVCNTIEYLLAHDSNLKYNHN